MSALNDLLIRAPRAGARRGPALARTEALAGELMFAAMFVEQAVAPQPTPAPGKINPTKRVLRFIVPLTDGPTYLGEVELAVAPDDSLSVLAPRLLQLLEPLVKPPVFMRVKAAVGSAASVTATQLAAENIHLAYDNQKLSLAISIPVAARRIASLSLRSGSSMGSETLKPAAFSAYANLRSAVDLVEQGPGRGFVPPVSLVDGAVRALGVVAESEAYFSLRKNEPVLRRTGSRLVYDDLKDTIRFSLGDVRPFARSFQSAPTVAGLSVARFYNILDPQREVRSTGSQGFSLFAPSTVETIVNGRTVERKLLQPGSYTLQDFPLAEGSNDVRLQIEDETGKRRSIEFNLYSNRQLLEPGTTEFAAFGGVYAYPTRSGMHYSRAWSSSGFVRRGISQQLTAGVNGQADATAQLLGTELLLGSGVGLIGFDLAVSRRTAGTGGLAAGMTFEKIIQSASSERSHSFRGQVEYRSARFAVPGALLPLEPIALRASAGYAVTLSRDTFVALDAQYERDRVQRERRYGVRASAGFRLSETLAVVGEVQWDRGGQSRNGGAVRFGLRRRIGSRGTAQVDIDSHGVARASFQDSGGRGIGSWSGSVDVNRDVQGTTLNASGSYLANRMELGVSQLATYSALGNAITNVRTSVRASTSFAFADGSFAMGRPIQDGFVIAVPHHSLGRSAVRIDPQGTSEEAHSGALGGALEGALSAYSPRLLVFDVPGAPPGYDLGSGNVQLLPPYRAGYRLEVGSDYHLLVLGRLLDREGEPISLLAGKALDLKAPKRAGITMFTSRDGKFGAQGLRPGKWRIEMPTEPPTIFEINVIDSPTGTVRVGDIHPVGQGRAKQ